MKNFHDVKSSERNMEKSIALLNSREREQRKAIWMVKNLKKTELLEQIKNETRSLMGLTWIR